MKKQPTNSTDARILRQKAEEKLNKKESKVSSLSTESNAIKLSHELAVHQIELEIQNKELIDSRLNLEEVIEKYTGLYDFAPTGYLTLSREGQIIELNFCAAKMLGKERQRLMKNILGLFITTDTKQIFNLFLKEVFNSEVKQSCEATLVSDGNLPVSVYLVGLANKKNDQCDISMIDITERKQAEQKVKNILIKLTIANKELDQSLKFNADKDLFITILAHDLRNPFGVLLGFTELLLENIHKFDINETENIVKAINKSTRNTYTLLEDLLRWSRVRIGKFPFEPKSLNFTSICKDIINIFSANAKTKNISIYCSAMPGIYVVADVDMLKVVLRNLVSNAIKFTNTNGIIKISAEEKGSDILFSVSNTGIGIEPDRLPKLFDIAQYRTTRGTANENGTGLGLLLCKEFVEKHGGKIWAESEHGQGSVFYFNIPHTSESKSQNIVSDTEEESEIKNLKILIVDDDSTLRFILSNMIKSYAKEIFYAETGVDAIAVYKNNPDIDLILLDIHMPKMNGYETANQIKAINKDVIIIVETADSISDITGESTREGINDYFFKPYNKTFLNQLIEKHFSKNIKGHI